MMIQIFQKLETCLNNEANNVLGYIVPIPKVSRYSHFKNHEFEMVQNQMMNLYFSWNIFQNEYSHILFSYMSGGNRDFFLSQVYVNEINILFDYYAMFY